jgi:hypothetical protein
MRFWPLQRLPVRAALCGVAGFPHDAASALSTCTVARPCGFSLTADFSIVRSFAWPVVASPAACRGRCRLRSPLSRVIRGPLSTVRRTRPDPERSARPGRSSLRKRGGAHGVRVLRSFAPARRFAEDSASTHLPLARLTRAWACFLPKDRPACSILLPVGRSGLVDRGSWVFRRASRTVPTRRERPLLPWTSPLPGLSDVASDMAEARAGRVSSPCASHRFPVLGGTRRPPRP